MALETSADRTAYVAAFGVAATVDGTSVTAIFDYPHYESLGVEGNNPQLIITTESVASVAYGDAVSVAGTSYTVKSVQPDGTGFTLLMLEAV